MPRFAVLTHDHPFLHWDLLLEWGESARTWRLLREPGAGEMEVEPLPDHRLHYLDYEGPVSGNRGHVTLWDQGEYELIEEVPALHVRLHGKQLQGDVVIHGPALTFSPRNNPS